MLNVPVHRPVLSSQSPRAVSPSTNPSPVALPLPLVADQVSLPSASTSPYSVKRSPGRVALPVAAPCLTDISSRYFVPQGPLLKVVCISPAHSPSEGYRFDCATLVELQNADAATTRAARVISCEIWSLIISNCANMLQIAECKDESKREQPLRVVSLRWLSSRPSCFVRGATHDRAPDARRLRRRSDPGPAE